MLAGLGLLPARRGGTARDVTAQLERAAACGFFLERRGRRLARGFVLLGAGLGQRLVQRAFGLRRCLRVGNDRWWDRSGFLRGRSNSLRGFRGGFLGFLFLLGLSLLGLILLLGDVFLLLGDQCGTLARLFLPRREFRCGHDRLRRCGFFRRRRRLCTIALDENALLPHLDLDRARTPGAVRRLDFGGLLAREGDLLFQLEPAVLLAEVVEQACLVLLGKLVAFLLAADAGCRELLQQDAGRHLQFGREFLDRGQGHIFLRALAMLGGLVPRWRRFHCLRTSARVPS